MKRGALEHPKMADLQKRLGTSRAAAAGHFEAFLHYVAKYTPAGDAGRFGADALARGSLWEGDSSQFVEAMIGAGFLEDANGCLVVHDWPDHCDDAVHMSLARARRRFANGSVPKLGRFGKDERAEIQADFAKTHGTRTAHAQSTHGTRTEYALPSPPLPSPPPPSPPIPSPPRLEMNTTSNGNGSASRFDGSIPSRWRTEIVTVWNLENPKVRVAGPKDAMHLNDAIWSIHHHESLPEASRDAPFDFLCGKVRDYRKSRVATKEGGKYCATLGNFLHRSKYLEGPDQWNFEPSSNGTHEKFDAHKAVAEALAADPLPERKARR